MSVQRTLLRIVLAAVALALSGWQTPLAAQAPTGPLTPPKSPEVIRLPTQPAPEKPPMAPEEIIRRFAQQEDAVSLAFGEFTYRKTIRLEEFGPDGKPSGRGEVITQMMVELDGSRRPRPVGRQEPTLRFAALEPDVLEVLGHMPVFPFATSQLQRYNITYQASERVDDLMTYVFQVAPRQLSRQTAYFSGVIWVDDRDFAIVKMYGKWVTETGEVKLTDLPFTFYETYRQYVSGKYWMPAYTRSDGFLGGGDARVPVRLTIRWENYRPVSAGNPPLPPAQPSPDDRPTLAPRSGR
jgi:hypothetical protein